MAEESLDVAYLIVLLKCIHRCCFGLSEPNGSLMINRIQMDILLDFSAHAWVPPSGRDAVNELNPK